MTKKPLTSGQQRKVTAERHIKLAKSMDFSRPLKNVRYETFAQDWVLRPSTKKKNYQVYVDAGYNDNGNKKQLGIHAMKMSNHPFLRGRIEHLQTRKSEANIATKDEISEKLTAILRTGLKDDPHAAVKAASVIAAGKELADLDGHHAPKELHTFSRIEQIVVSIQRTVCPHCGGNLIPQGLLSDGNHNEARPDTSS